MTCPACHFGTSPDLHAGWCPDRPGAGDHHRYSTAMNPSCVADGCFARANYHHCTLCGHHHQMMLNAQKSMIAQQALANMRSALETVRSGHILKTELVSEGTRTYSRVVNEWRIKELEDEVKRLKEALEQRNADVNRAMDDQWDLVP